MADREIELKYLCAPEDLDEVLAAAPAGEDEVLELTSTYYDTPDGALAALQVSLRVRFDGRAHVQTLKRGKGVFREEHEAVLPGASLDAEMPALAALLSPGQRARLQVVSTVHVTRRQRLVTYQGAAIEIAADLGEVRAGGRAEPISEVELELKTGPKEALFALGEALSQATHLTLSFESKSSRGRALGAPPPSS